MDYIEKGIMTGIYRSLLFLQIFVAAAFCLNACQANGKRPVAEFCSDETLRNTTSIYMYSPTTDTPVKCYCHVTRSYTADGDVILDYVEGNNVLDINVTYDKEKIKFGDNQTKVTLDADQTLVILLRTEKASNDSLVCVGVTAANQFRPIDVVCYNAATNGTPTTTTSTQGSSRHDTAPHSTSGSTTNGPSSSEVSNAESTPSTSGPVSTPSATNESTTTSAYMLPSGADKKKLNIGIVIAIAAGAFVILVTIVTMITVILCSRRKRQKEEDANVKVKESDIDMTENVLYDTSSLDDRAVDAAGDRGTFVNDVNTVNSDVDANTVQAGVDIHHDEFAYAQVMKRELLK